MPMQHKLTRIRYVNIYMHNILYIDYIHMYVLFSSVEGILHQIIGILWREYCIFVKAKPRSQNAQG